MIKRTFNLTIGPTPEELAKEFWGMGDEEQAKFFNHLGEIADSSKFVLQLQMVTDRDVLSEKGKTIMRFIGDYSDPS